VLLYFLLCFLFALGDAVSRVATIELKQSSKRKLKHEKLQTCGANANANAHQSQSPQATSRSNLRGFGLAMLRYIHVVVEEERAATTFHAFHS